MSKSSLETGNAKLKYTESIELLVWEIYLILLFTVCLKTPLIALISAGGLREPGNPSAAA